MKDPKYFILDTETGGLPHQKPSLLSIYGVLLDEELNSLPDISLLIKPDDGVYKVNVHALQMNKINLIEHNKTALTETAARKALEHYFHINGAYSVSGKIIPIGQNVNFDIGFMQDLYPDWNNVMSHRNLDTASIIQFLKLAGAIKLPAGQEGSLEELASYFGIDYSGAHESKFDTLLTLQLLKNYIKLIQI